MTTASAAPTAATLSQRLASYVHELRYDDIDPRAIDKLKEHLLEHLALAFEGRSTDAGRQAIRVARILSDDRGDCTIVGEARKAAPLDALFANCTLMRAKHLDDVLFPVGVHIGLVTMPVAWAIAERGHLSGKDLLTAVIAGYDAVGTLGNPVWAWAADTPRRPTIPFGPFGGAVVAAKLFGLDAERTTEAIGYAAHMAMGLAEGDLTTHYYSLVARNGYMAGILAREGGVAADTALEGKRGFYRTFFGSLPDGLEETFARLGREFHIMGATTKRYPGTGLNILPVELTKQLVAEHRIARSQVKRVRLFLPVEREKFEGGHKPPPYDGALDATSSAQFLVANVLVDGRLDLARNERYDDEGMLDLVRRIDVVLEPGHPIRYARVEVATTDGRTLSREGDDHAFPPHERVARIRDAGRGIVGDAQLERLVGLIADLESVGDVAEVMRCVAPGS